MVSKTNHCESGWLAAACACVLGAVALFAQTLYWKRELHLSHDHYSRDKRIFQTKLHKATRGYSNISASFARSRRREVHQNSAITRLRHELGDLQASNASLAAWAGRARSQLYEAEMKIRTLTIQLHEAEMKRRTLTIQRESFTAEHNEAEMKIRTLTIQRESLTAEHNEAEMKIRTLTIQREKYLARSLSRIKCLRGALLEMINQTAYELPATPTDVYKVDALPKLTDNRTSFCSLQQICSAAMMSADPGRRNWIRKRINQVKNRASMETKPLCLSERVPKDRLTSSHRAQAMAPIRSDSMLHVVFINDRILPDHIFVNDLHLGTTFSSIEQMARMTRASGTPPRARASRGHRCRR